MTLEEATAKVKELEGSVDSLTTERDSLKETEKSLTKERDDLKAQLDNPEKDPELEALKTELAAMKKGIHDGLVDAVVEARFKAGLIAKKEDEKARIIEFSDDMLKILTEDALLVAGKLEAVKSSGPKSRYGVTETNDFKEAMEKQREAFYGYRRGLDGTVLS
jgi:chromosome segregation ATPase